MPQEQIEMLKQSKSHKQDIADPVSLINVNSGQAAHIFDDLIELVRKDLAQNGSTKKRSITIQINFDKDECKPGFCNTSVSGKVTLPPRENFPKMSADFSGHFIIQKLPFED